MGHEPSITRWLRSLQGETCPHVNLDLSRPGAAWFSHFLGVVVCLPYVRLMGLDTLVNLNGLV